MSNLYTDNIDEKTADTGVTIESVLHKDGKIQNLPLPSVSGDAANKSYVDSNVGDHASDHWFGSGDAIDLAKLRPSGDVDYNYNKIINLSMPSASGDVSNKQYVDDTAGVSTFTSLTDTPASFSGQATKYPRVNAGETALEFSAGATAAHASDHWHGSGDQIDLAKLQASGDMDIGGYKIGGVATPIASGDAATKGYADSAGSVDYAQYVTVAKSGGDYTTITAALNAITDAATGKRYCILVYPGDYAETVTCKSWVDIVGLSRHVCRITKSDATSVLTSSNNCTLRNLSLISTYSADDACCIGLSNDEDNFIMRNCYVEHIGNYSGHLKGIRTSYFSHERYLQMYNCKVYVKNSNANGEVFAIEISYAFTLEYCSIIAEGGSSSDYTVALYVEGYYANYHGYIRKTRIELIAASNADNRCIRLDANKICYLHILDSELLGSSGTTGIQRSGGTLNLYLKNVYEEQGRSGSMSVNYLSVPALGIKNTPAGSIAATDVQAAINELDDEKMKDWANVPNASGDTGISGDIAHDADYLYVAIDDNAWKRTALSSW